MEILGILALAIFIEGTVEYFLAKEGAHQPALKYIAVILGVVLAIAYDVDILSDLAGMQSIVPLIGNVVSGVVIGRGSNVVNDFIGMLRAKRG